jgi:hypothetical protein
MVLFGGRRFSRAPARTKAGDAPLGSKNGGDWPRRVIWSVKTKEEELGSLFWFEGTR